MKDELQRRLKIITVSVAAWGGIAALFSLQRLYAVAAKGVVLQCDPHAALGMKGHLKVEDASR